MLKPFIRRDYESRPLKLKLMEEIRKRNPEFQDVGSRPIDYCYVQPHHIPAVSAMCREFFWSGIDCEFSLLNIF
jgi:cysteine-rich protein 2-binding protein